MDNPPRPIGALPAFYGVLAALGLGVELVVAEAGLTAGPFQPGVLLGWVPLLAAATAVLMALRLGGADREALFAGAIAALGLSWLLDPAPAAWMPLAPLAAVAMVLAVRLAPATRLVASVPAVAGLVAALQAVPALSGSLFALAVVAVHVAALSWMRVGSRQRAAAPAAWSLETATFEPAEET